MDLPKANDRGNGGQGGGQRGGGGGTYEHLGQDILSTIKEETIGYEGMKIDRMFYEKFEGTVRDNPARVASAGASAGSLSCTSARSPGASIPAMSATSSATSSAPAGTARMTGRMTGRADNAAVSPVSTTRRVSRGADQ